MNSKLMKFIGVGLAIAGFAITQVQKAIESKEQEALIDEKDKEQLAQMKESK